MEPDTKDSVEQSAQPTEQGNVQDSTESNAALGTAIADAKKYRHQRQQLEAKVTELQDQISSKEEADMQKNNEWKDLATKYKSERDEYKSLAKEGKAIKEAVRKNLLDQLSEEDREFAIDLSTEKLEKFVNRSVPNEKVATNESYSTSMPDRSVNPFIEMTKEQRQRNWAKIIQNYAKK